MLEGTVTTFLPISNETREKILQMLGLKDESLKKKLIHPSRNFEDKNEEFKVLILIRGIIDKFSSKPVQNKPFSNVSSSKIRNSAYNQVNEISELKPSLFSDIEREYQGNSFYIHLFRAAKQQKINLNIPATIIAGGGLGYAIKLWTSENGTISSKQLRLTEVKNELNLFKPNKNPSLPSFIIRFEHQSSSKIRYQSFCYKFTEIQELFTRLSEIQYFRSPVMISEYIQCKGNVPSKFRCHFDKQSQKVFSVNKVQEEPVAAKTTKMKLTSFVPATLLDSLSYNQEDLAMFEQAFQCTLVFPVRINANACINKNHEHSFARFAHKVIYYLQEIIEFALESSNSTYAKSRLASFSSYLKLKLDKLNTFLDSEQSGKQEELSPADQRKEWDKSQMVRLTESSISIYEVTNMKKLEFFNKLYLNLIKSIRSTIPHSKLIKEAVIDYIEGNQGIFLIKLLHIRFEQKKIVSLPSLCTTKHISLFSATEGVGYSKGKHNRQLLCCGDYCKLLKRNDFETREKIEFLMKHHVEYAGTLFELMKLQDLLNVDIFQHLLRKTRRPVTPITNQMQYKILRKIILEDRCDRYSLRNLILNLPNAVIHELNIILEDETNTSALNIYIEKNKSEGIKLNKKLNWEFELVPVCDKCYKIYSKRANDKNAVKGSTKVNQSKTRVPTQNSESSSSSDDE
jgi:hypothetical protein